MKLWAKAPIGNKAPFPIWAPNPDQNLHTASIYSNGHKLKCECLLPIYSIQS